MKNSIPSYVRVPVLFFLIFGFVEYYIESGEQPAFMEYPEVGLFLVFVLLLLIALEAILSSMKSILFRSMNKEAQERFLASEEKKVEFAWFKKLYQNLTKSKPIEEEGEIILDHNYDGIRELDNALPPWWLYGFYATVIFGIVYMFKYHVFNGDNQYVELENEIAEAQLELEEYKKTAKDLIDISTVALLTDASDLSIGKNIFEANCVACHKSDGGGGIGPNLTDEYWILGGGIKNVFKTVSEGGRDGKGMVAWKTMLRPSQIAQVSSYLLQFQGTTPAEPKAPEGEIWVDESIKETEDNSSETQEIDQTEE